MALKIRQFDGDGQPHRGTFEVPIRDPRTGEVLEDVVLICNILTKDEARAYYRRHTTKEVDPQTRAVTETVDNLAAADALMADLVVDWRGVVGFDDQPLAVLPDTIKALDDRIKAQVIDLVMGGEVTGRGPDTFRAIAAVPDVVAG